MQVTYELSTSSIGTAETAIGSLSAVTNDFRIISFQGTLFDTTTTAGVVTWRLRHATNSGTGSAVTNLAKTNGTASATPTTTAKDTMTVIPTGLTTMDGASVPFNQAYLKTTLPGGAGLNLKVKAGEFCCFTVERPGASGTPVGRVFVTIDEGGE